MTTDIWGPHTWIFLHTLATKVYHHNFHKILNFIIQICQNLPCPDCTIHATQFIQQNLHKFYNPKKNILRSNEQHTHLTQFLYVFHNSVNKRKRQPKFDYNKIQIYSKISIITAFYNFANVFHTRGNLTQINESFRRQMLIESIRKWIITNYKDLIKINIPKALTTQESTQETTQELTQESTQESTQDLTTQDLTTQKLTQESIKE